MPNYPQRFSLGHFPTPVEPLEHLTKLLGGPRLYIKRDDMTGLAGGGNKVRKLEYLVADACAAGSDTLITLGAPQSNHCRQTAAAAVRCGMRCLLVLRGHPVPVEGNLVLDSLLGAELIWSRDRSREEVMEELVAEERRAGHRPYPIVLGGSNALGAVGYAVAMKELCGQEAPPFDRIVFASSSGGTHAGMVAGAHLAGCDADVFGISIDEELADLQRMVALLASECAGLLGSPRAWDDTGIHASADYLGEGYGIVGAPEREAIKLFARREGILLDPVYTGRAAAGMIDMIRRGLIGPHETVLFWHTGGIPALFAYGESLLTNDE
jgi:L-cysteate sulfo-lyase